MSSLIHRNGGGGVGDSMRVPLDEQDETAADGVGAAHAEHITTENGDILMTTSVTAAAAPCPTAFGSSPVFQSMPSSSSSRCGACVKCCFTVLRLVNSFAVAILVGLVVFLFIQVQLLTTSMKQQQAELTSLELRLQNQTTTQIQELSEKVDQEQNLTLYQMAGTFTLLASLLTMFHMSSHLRNFYQPMIQRKIVAILWLSPIYAVTSFFSLVFPSADGYLAVIKDFYEAYAIFVFLSFLISVLGKGDRELAVRTLANHVDHLKRPTRCLRNCYHPPPETSDMAFANAVLTECQIMCMQFVFVRPLTSIATFVYNTVMEQQERARGGDLAAAEDALAPSSAANTAADFFKSPTFYIAMVTNISVFLAFTGLLKFYHAIRDDLAWCQPFSKFMTIKGIVFLTFWQGLLISIIVQVWQKDERASAVGVAVGSDATTTPGSDSEWDYVDENNNSTGGRILYETNHQEGYTQGDGHEYTDPKQQAAQIQNFLICLEMLFFSIAHWCVFPAEEWEPDYRPKHYAKPGIGLSDFVSDMSYIINSRSEARRAARSRSETDGEDENLAGGEDEDEDEEEGSPSQQAAIDDDALAAELFGADPSAEDDDVDRSQGRNVQGLVVGTHPGESGESGMVEMVPTSTTSKSAELFPQNDNDII